MAFVTCENLVKIYKVENLEVVALQGLDLGQRTDPGKRAPLPFLGRPTCF